MSTAPSAATRSTAPARPPPPRSSVSPASAAFHGLQFTNNTIMNSLGDGLACDGDHNWTDGNGATLAPAVIGNRFKNCAVGVNLGSKSLNTPTSTRRAVISGNTFLNNAGDALQGGFQSTDIRRNTFQANGGSGLLLTSFGSSAPDRGAQNCVISENAFLGNAPRARPPSPRPTSSSPPIRPRARSRPTTPAETRWRASRPPAPSSTAARRPSTARSTGGPTPQAPPSRPTPRASAAPSAASTRKTSTSRPGSIAAGLDGRHRGIPARLLHAERRRGQPAKRPTQPHPRRHQRRRDRRRRECPGRRIRREPLGGQAPHARGRGRWRERTHARPGHHHNRHQRRRRFPGALDQRRGRNGRCPPAYRERDSIHGSNGRWERRGGSARDLGNAHEPRLVAARSPRVCRQCRAGSRPRRPGGVVPEHQYRPVRPR